MRKQVNELMNLAKQLREVIIEYKLSDVAHKSHKVSEKITAHSIGDDYHSVSFLNSGLSKLDVTMYRNATHSMNNIAIDSENLSDEDLDNIILRSTQEIGIFIAELQSDEVDVPTN